MPGDTVAGKFELHQPFARRRTIRRYKLPLSRGVRCKPCKVLARAVHLQILGDDISGPIDGDVNRDFNLAMDRPARAAGDGGNLLVQHR